MGTAELYRDIEIVIKRFPKLEHVIDNQLHKLCGTLDICDTIGNYRGAFDIEIILPPAFPYVVPLVREISAIIPREQNRHISNDGFCCLDIDHKLLYMAKVGIKLVDFVANKVYPFFANQVFFEDNKDQYASGEYQHGFHGIIQFYRDDLNLGDHKLAIQVLELILTGKIPDKYSKCICGLKRFDKCHHSSFQFLESVGRDRLEKDLTGFRAILSNINSSVVLM